MSQTSFAEMYERFVVGPLFHPWAEIALELAAFSPGDRILDIACGTGIVVRLAKQRSGKAVKVVGVDLSSDMLAVARAIAPTIDWREGDAGALPLAEGEQFDLVVCQQGLQFFADKPRAAAQMRRALVQGGRLVVAVWRSDHEIPFMWEMRRVAERRLGPVNDRRHSYGDAAALEALLRDAGLSEVRSTRMSRIARFDDGTTFARMNTRALVTMSAVGNTLGADERNRLVDAIVAESASVLERFTEGSSLAIELSANVAVAKG